MDRRGFLKNIGLAVPALVVVTRAAEPAVFDADDPPFADTELTNVRVIGQPGLNLATVQLKGYQNGVEVWSHLTEVPTRMAADDKLIILPYPDTVEIKMDRQSLGPNVKSVRFNKLKALLPTYFGVEVDLLNYAQPSEFFMQYGDVLTLNPTAPGLLVITQ